VEEIAMPKGWSKWLRWGKELNHSTLRTHYAEYRREVGLPERCDNPACWFHMARMEWNGKPLRPIVDHIGGARRNNRPEALQYLCPNCNSQQDTHAGRNKGRIFYDEAGSAYTRIRTRGRKEGDVRMMAESLDVRPTFYPVDLRISGGSPPSPDAETKED
jgi:hypothetical protein